MYCFLVLLMPQIVLSVEDVSDSILATAQVSLKDRLKCSARSELSS